jgi:two-component system cell cycle sensor histidine kinase PleC
MADGPNDPKWPALISLSAHELRAPLSPILGYLRMLLMESAGPLADSQRQMLLEVEKSCARLAGVLAEMSELAQLESRTAPMNRGTVNLHAILTAAIAALPKPQGQDVAIELTADTAITVHGDAVRLRTAFSSILNALRRELVTSNQMAVRVDLQEAGGPPTVRITIGDVIQIDELVRLGQARRTTFDEFRGGSGLSLPNARRIIESHGGRLWSAAVDGHSNAIVLLPL